MSKRWDPRDRVRIIDVIENRATSEEYVRDLKRAVDARMEAEREDMTERFNHSITKARPSWTRAFVGRLRLRHRCSYDRYVRGTLRQSPSILATTVGYAAFECRCGRQRLRDVRPA